MGFLAPEGGRAEAFILPTGYPHQQASSAFTNAFWKKLKGNLTMLFTNSAMQLTEMAAGAPALQFTLMLHSITSLKYNRQVGKKKKMSKSTTLTVNLVNRTLGCEHANTPATQSLDIWWTSPHTPVGKELFYHSASPATNSTDVLALKISAKSSRGM